MKNYEITKLGNSITKQSSSLWANDKYPNNPELLAKNKVVLLDVTGPGVVTSIHTTRFSPRLKDVLWDWDSKYIRDVIIKVWYDFEKTPSIDMPFFDFLGDIQGDSTYYSTIYFSKVRRANNFRLPMPFKKHIKIEIENPTETSLSGLIDVQYDVLENFPENMGYLKVQNIKGKVNIPKGNIILCNIPTKGSIVANWLQLECDDELCKEGEVLCEGNDEFYLDGEENPSLEYLGTEDFFGFSWGFSALESNYHSAIIKKEELPNKGSKIALIRCRDTDKINFSNSCKVLLEYKHEINKDLKSLNPLISIALQRGDIVATINSCFYYYGILKSAGLE